MENWRKIVNIFNNGFLKYHGVRYNSEFEELIFRNLPYEDIEEFVFEQFIESAGYSIKRGTGIYRKCDVVDYIRKTVNDFIFKVSTTNVSQILLPDRRYVIINFQDLAERKPMIKRIWFNYLFEKSLRYNNSSLRVLIVLKHVKVPPAIYFWFCKIAVIVLEKNPEDMEQEEVEKLYRYVNPFSF